MPVEIVGMLRDQDRSNSFTPSNNAEKNEWIFPNIEEMAAHMGSAPVLVDEIFSAFIATLFYIKTDFLDDI